MRKKNLGCAYAECKYNEDYFCQKRKKPVITSSSSCPDYERDEDKEEFTDEELEALGELNYDYSLQEERDSWSAEQFNGIYSYETGVPLGKGE